MKHQELDASLVDWPRLNRRERALFLQAVRQINEAYALRGDQPPPHRPAALRIMPVHDAHGVREMTWPFSGPDGRATFELITIDGEPAIRWRRIGDHRIFRGP